MGDSDEQAVARLCARYPGRKELITSLSHLYLDQDQFVPPSVHIHDTNSGTRHALQLAKDVLGSSRTLHVLQIDPLTSPTVALVFKHLCSAIERLSSASLAETVNDEELEQLNEGSLDAMLDRFSDKVRRYLDGVRLDGEASHRFVILINRAERMRDLWPDALVAVIFKIADITSLQGKLSALTISTLGISQFRIAYGPGSHLAPTNTIALTCERLQKSDVCAALELEYDSLRTESASTSADALDSEALRSLFKTYIAIAYDAFASDVRQFEELRRLILSLWRPFVKPVVEGSEAVHATQRLIVRSHSIFRTALSDIHSYGTKPLSMDGAVKGRGQVDPFTLQQAAPVTLSAGFLMLASFLASYNPPRLDVRYFVRDESAIHAQTKGRTGRKKGGALRKVRNRRRQAAYADPSIVTQNQLLGPRSFALDRLLSIYQAMVTEAAPTLLAERKAEKVLVADGDGHALLDELVQWETWSRGTQVLQTVNTLLKSGHLVRTSAIDRLDVTSTFRTNISHDLALRVAKDLSIDLHQYFYA